MKEPCRAHIRWCIRRDMPDVLDIENASTDYPWSEEDFLRVLRQRNCIGMVAEHGERIVGFIVYELHRDKIVLLNLAVAPDFRRRGVGTQMINKQKGKLTPLRRTGISCVIRERFMAGALFLKSCGFKSVLVPGHFEDSGDDGYCFGFEHQAVPEISDKYLNVFTT